MLRKLSLPTKLTVMLAMSLLAVTVIVSLAGTTLLTADATTRAGERQEVNMRVAWDVMASYGKDFSRKGDVLYAGDTALNDFSAPVDRIKALVGGSDGHCIFCTIDTTGLLSIRDNTGVGVVKIMTRRGRDGVHVNSSQSCVVNI